jgi:hypothetical protein
MPVAGHSKSQVWLPLGAKTARPIVVGLHGKSETAANACDRLRKVAGVGVFVLCPSGPAPAFSLLDAATTAAELRASLGALKSRFAGHVAKSSVVLVGFENAADHAAHIAREEPAFFARVVLVNGGVEAWSATHSSLFGQRGGNKLLFVCSSQTCVNAAELHIVFTRRAGADAHVVFAGDGAPLSDPRLTQALGAEWAWLVQGDNRWQTAR